MQIGEVFFHMTPDEAQEYIDSKKDQIERDIQQMDEQADSLKKGLQELKVKLYAKFGNNINLEEEEESWEW